MPRTTTTLVEGQLGRNWDQKTDVSPYITTANIAVNNLVNRATERGTSVDLQLVADTDTLGQIECLLSCHFYQRHDPGFQATQKGRSGATFLGQAGIRFESTMYGQDALSLDYTGILASTGKGGKVSLQWLGKPKSSQIDYDQRN